MLKVKVVFVDGTGFLFEGDNFEHLADHRIFIIYTKGNRKIMLPDSAVAVIGAWDEDKKEFV